MRVLGLLLAALLLLPAAARAADPPEIAAPAAILVEPSSGDVAFEQEADARRPIASTTKLMTALLTLEQGGLDETATAPRYRAAPAESLLRPQLAAGEQMAVADLLRGLLIASANDAAVALATHVAGGVPSFVRRMNRRAQQLGLTNTSYANPIGLDDPDNFSSARDLATLTRELRRFGFFRRTVDTGTTTLTTGSTPRALDNGNLLLDRAVWVDGVKTGNTMGAGDVLVASAKRRGVPLIAVVLGGASREAAADDAFALLRYGQTLYKRSTAIGRGEGETELPIEYRPGATLSVRAGRTFAKVLRTDQEFGLEPRLPDEVEGPLERGDRVGTMRVTLDDELVAEVPLVADMDVPAAGAGRRAQDFLTRPATLALLGVVVLGAAGLFSRRTRQEAAA